MSKLLQLLITLNSETMQVNVSGNILRNKITAMGMLEFAKNAIFEMEITEDKPKIIVPDIVPPAGIGKS